MSKGMQIESLCLKGYTRPIAIPEYLVQVLGGSELPIGEILINFERYIMSIINNRVAKCIKENAFTFTISKTYRVNSAINNKPIKLRFKACFVSRRAAYHAHPDSESLPSFPLHSISVKPLELCVSRYKTFTDLKNAVLTSEIEKMITTDL